MHRGTRALLHCVALFSLLSHGNAAKGPAPAEVLTHFARAVGTILVPLPNIERAELQQQPQQQPAQPAQLEAQQVEEKQQEEKQNKTKIVAPIAATRRQVNSRQIPTQDADDGPVQQTPTHNGGLNPQQFTNQGDYPLQLGSAAYGNPNLQQLLGQSLLYQGAGGPFQGQFAGSDPRLLGLDPRLLQQLQGFNPYGLGQQGIPKPINPLGSNFNSINGNLKDTGSINSIQDADSKSGQNNRQYDPQDFQQGGGLGQQQTPQNIGGLNTVGVGGYRGYSGQLSYSPLNQQRQQYFNNFNDIGSFGNSGGSPFNQFQSAQLNYGGAGGSGVNGLGLGGNAGNGGGGGGESFFGNSQYQSQGGFNNFPGGAADGGQGFQGNFQSQFSQGFAGAGDDAGGASGFFAGGAGGGPGGFAGGAPGGFGGVNGFAGAGGLGGGGGFGSGVQGGGGGFGSGGQGGGSEFSGSSLRATATKETAEATNESALDKQQQKVLNQRFLQAKRREFGDKTSRVSSRS